MVRYLLPILLALILAGCQGEGRSFAGFTFGGGGSTFNCEPAQWSSDSTQFELLAGTERSATAITLRGRGLKLGEPAAITSASVRVPTHGNESAKLLSGHLVLQAEEGEVAHGSFDLKVKLDDGREFPVVGSFTAQRRLP